MLTQNDFSPDCQDIKPFFHVYLSIKDVVYCLFCLQRIFVNMWCYFPIGFSFNSAKFNTFKSKNWYLLFFSIWINAAFPLNFLLADLQWKLYSVCACLCYAAWIWGNKKSNQSWSKRKKKLHCEGESVVKWAHPLPASSCLLFFPPESYQFSVPESLPLQSVVARIKAADADIGTNAEMDYRIMDGDGPGMFNITTDEDTQEGVILLLKVVHKNLHRNKYQFCRKPKILLYLRILQILQPSSIGKVL